MGWRVRRVVSQPTFQGRGPAGAPCRLPANVSRPRDVATQVSPTVRWLADNEMPSRNASQALRPENVCFEPTAKGAAAPHRSSGSGSPLCGEERVRKASSRVVRVAQSRFGGQDRIGERQRCDAPQTRFGRYGAIDDVQRLETGLWHPSAHGAGSPLHGGADQRSVPRPDYRFGRLPSTRHNRDPAMIAPRIAPIVSPRTKLAVVGSSLRALMSVALG